MKQIETFEEAYAAVEDFTHYRNSRSKFGASDTEPNNFFVTVMRTALCTASPIESLFDSENPWSLYSSVKGWKSVSTCLTRKVKALIERLGEARYLAIVEIIKYYGWNY
jgi:hypothetical protein